MSILHELQTEQVSLPDHTQLPETDGTFVRNDQEHPQSSLLTDSLQLTLAKIHPDAQYCIGQDLGIYWRSAEPDEPAVKGAVSPDWYYVPNVPRTLGGHMRRSYVLWQEWVGPLVALEFVSGDGSEERDQTPGSGKFWVYEKAIRIPFYGIYEVKLSRVTMHELIQAEYRIMKPNERGHYPIPALEVEIGIWEGQYQNVTLPWLRWWDLQGNVLLTGHERAALESLKAEEVTLQADKLAARADKLAAQLRALGVEPEA